MHEQFKRLGMLLKIHRKHYMNSGPVNAGQTYRRHYLIKNQVVSTTVPGARFNATCQQVVRWRIWILDFLKTWILIPIWVSLIYPYRDKFKIFRSRDSRLRLCWIRPKIGIFRFWDTHVRLSMSDVEYRYHIVFMCNMYLIKSYEIVSNGLLGILDEFNITKQS